MSDGASDVVPCWGRPGAVPSHDLTTCFIINREDGFFLFYFFSSLFANQPCFSSCICKAPGSTISTDAGMPPMTRRRCNLKHEETSFAAAARAAGSDSARQEASSSFLATLTRTTWRSLPWRKSPRLTSAA
jgi:hypothetical protein